MPHTPPRIPRYPAPRALFLLVAILLIAAAPAQRSDADFSVYIIPEDGVYVGDQVSFLVLPPAGFDTEDQTVRVHLDGQQLGEATFSGFGIGGRPQATLKWVWDTAGLPPGDYALEFTVLPDGRRWTHTVTVLPAPLVDQDWVTVSNDCCVIYTVSGTASQRDIAHLLAVSQRQADAVMARMGVEFAEPLEMVVLPRVLGHGGFAWGELYVSYLDRNYSSEQFGIVVHHEMVHVLDERLGGELRPNMLAEGLAVYLTGGHFKPEPLFSRAATLHSLGYYVPLERLANNFYNEQHEVGYLEAAALVQYMVDRWGYPAFDAFYRDIHRQSTGGDARAIDLALRAHFGLGLNALEHDFVARLRAFPVLPDLAEDVASMVAYYDTLRDYQLLLDPNAYFLQAWLLKIGEMQAHDITADYVRHPQSAENIAFETLLIAAREEYELGRYENAEAILGAVNTVFLAYQQGAADPFAAHPLAAAHLQVVRALLDAGYQPHAITIDDQHALATVAAALDGQPQQVSLRLDGALGWRLE